MGVAANPAWVVSLDQGAPHTPCTLSEPQKCSIQWKVLPSPKTILHWGGFLSTHCWQPTQETDAANLCGENETFQMWAFIVYMFIPSILHPGLCFRVNGHLRPRLTCSVCAADSTASDRIRKRKHESHISALKNPSRLCGTAKKKNPKNHKLQVFSEAEQLKPRGWFLDVLAAVTCLNHDISYCPAVSPDTHFSLVWITSQYLCCYSQWKKTTKIQDQGGSFWNNKWQKLLSQREYDKNQQWGLYVP